MNPSEAAPLEPFGHDFLKPAPTHSEASRKRKKDDGSAFGSTTTDFSASTRDKLKALLHGQCFHCEMKPVLYSPMDVCHVIPKKSANYPRHFADGLLDFSLDDVVNSILLCKNCHNVFEDPEPGCTLLPTDLEYFIQFEEENFNRRQAIVDGRQQEQRQLYNVPPLSLLPPLRRCPTAGEYLEAWIRKEPNWPSSALGGAYTRFTMPGYMQRRDAIRMQAWHGAPMAAILHAFRAVLGNITPPEFVTPSIKEQLRKLQELYERRLETGPGDDPSINLGELPLPNTRASASANAPNLAPGPSMRSLPPPQSFSSTRDPLADQVEIQAHDAQRRPTESAPALSPTILAQTVVAKEASLEQSSKKRRRTSSSASLLQHRRRSRPPPSPALTREASTVSQYASPGLQPHLSVTHNKGEEGEETGEDPFSHVFRYDWKWGPQISTREKVERFLSRSDQPDMHPLD